jgi:hypothetical protein
MAALIFLLHCVAIGTGSSHSVTTYCLAEARTHRKLKQALPATSIEMANSSIACRETPVDIPKKS